MCRSDGEIYLPTKCWPLSTQVRVQKAAWDSVGIVFFEMNLDKIQGSQHREYERGETQNSFNLV